MLPDPSQWFFITGCQRSGTTLLRLILESHSQVHCFEEARSYRLLARRHRGPDIQAARVGFKVPRLAEQFDQAETYDYGLAEPPQGFYQGQPILFLVRDVRDTVASMLKLGHERSWLEKWAVPIIEEKVRREPAFAERFADELAHCRESSSPSAYGTLYWVYKNEALLRYTRAGYPALPISYEALVADPEAELRRICRKLEIDFEPSLLAHPEHAHGALGQTGLAIGNTDPSRSIDQASVGQWRSWLSVDDLAVVREIAGPWVPRLRSVVPVPPFD